jgi:3-dehydroquinate dehydratase-1
MFEEFVLAASTDTLETAARADAADVVEFRMDLASDPLDQLAAYEGVLPLIVTNRAAWEGGEADGRDRYDVLSEAVDHPSVVAVDIELAALTGTLPADGSTDAATEQSHAEELRSQAREAGVEVIASVHDFTATPPADELVDLLATATTAGDIGKLATTATNHGDALAMLRATNQATAVGHQVATMCMGEPGRHTRAVAPVYGSVIGYAPVVAAEATAPGQYPLDTLRRLVDDLRGAAETSDRPKTER